MKKMMMLAALAAIAATACTKTFEVNPTPADQAIGFGSWTNTMTKAEHRPAGSNDFLSGDTFNVYGYKTMAGDVKTTVFDGDVVTAYDVNGATDGGAVSYWRYDALRFWDPASVSYTFFAASPSDQLATAPAQTGLFVSNELTFSGANNDILVAAATTVLKASYSSSAVQLSFNHMAAQVDFKVKMDASLEAAGATVAIQGASLTDICTKGTLSINAYNAVSGAPEVATSGSKYQGWTPDAIPTTSDFASTLATALAPLTITAYTAYDGNHDAGATTGTLKALFPTYIMMPQNLDAGQQKVVLNYTITAGGNTSTYEDVEVSLNSFVTLDKNNNAADAITGWAPGKHYTYYITIGANAITFTADINPWTPEAGYRYLLQ